MTFPILTTNVSPSAPESIPEGIDSPRLDQTKDDLLQTNTRLLIFRLAGHDLAVSLNRVQRIVPMAALSRPPGLPSMIAGFLNHQGTAIGVLRLDRLFNLSCCEPGLYSALLLVQCKGTLFAWLVDSVSQIVNCPQEKRMPVSAEQSFNGCCEAETVLNGRPIHLLSPDCVLLEKELQTAEQFQAMAQERLDQLKGEPI